MKLLSEIETLLKLTSLECKNRNVIKQHTKTLNKYKTRTSPPYSANNYCGNMYISKANKNNICIWQKRKLSKYNKMR